MYAPSAFVTQSSELRREKYTAAWRFIVVLLVGLVISLFAPQVMLGAPITVPTDLNVGDTYRLAFVTTTVRDATSTNIADYNAFVTATANGVPELAALGTAWTAIASTSAVAARDNTGTNPTVSAGVPIYRLDNVRIADNNADLWDGSIAQRLAINQNATFTDAQPWAGTTAAGLSDPTFPLGAASARTGWTAVANSQWIEYPAAYSSSGSLQLYAISGELTVVPEPGAMALAGCGLGLLALMARFRRRNDAAAKLLICVPVLVGIPATAGASPIVIPIDPFATYLHINGDTAADTVPIDLAAIGISPGDTLRLERLGDWEAGGGCTFDACTGLAGVFSASTVLLPASQVNRVQDAIDAGSEIVTVPTQSGGQPTDIAEDFLISTEYFEFPPISSVIIQVPALATHLFVAAPDSRYADNSDPDADFALCIALVPEPSTAVLASLASLAFLSAVAVHRRRGNG
jgi:hypothetical protein